MRSQNNHLNVSATRVNYFSTSFADRYLASKMEDLEGDASLENAAQGLDRKAQEVKKFQLSPMSR